MNAVRETPVIQECKKALSKTYGKRLKGIVLYGSVARNEAEQTSDIDLLVLLAPPFDYFAELRKIVDVLYPIQLESERLISAKPVSVNDFQAGSLSLYRNAARDGIAI